MNFFNFRFFCFSLHPKLYSNGYASVWQAVFRPTNENVAIKTIDLDKGSLETVRKEIKVLSSCRHSNILKYHTSFVQLNSLWVVSPLMEGSVAELMQKTHPTGFRDEDAIGCILRQALSGLSYLHENLIIHRDVRAASLLIDRNGVVCLSNLKSAVVLSDGFFDRRGLTQAFIETPCYWIAPEVMEQVSGYDYACDLWSFGILALELANGDAPYAGCSPLKVLLMTLQNEPPTLDSVAQEDGGKRRKYSTKLKEAIASCLKKDPNLRPQAHQLLETPFFKSAKKPDYLIKIFFGKAPQAADRKQTRLPSDQSIKQSPADLAPKKVQWVFPKVLSESSTQDPGVGNAEAGYSWNTDHVVKYKRGPLIEKLGSRSLYSAEDATSLAQLSWHELPYSPPNDAAFTEATQENLKQWAAIRHPHVLNIIDLWCWKGRLVFLTDPMFSSLDRFVRENGPAPIRSARVFARQLALVLQHLHSTGMVHGNVCPTQIMVASTEPLTILLRELPPPLNVPPGQQWGSKLDRDVLPLAAGEAGAPKEPVLNFYRAPELSMPGAATITPQSDVYALGMVLLKILVGSISSRVTANPSSRPADVIAHMIESIADKEAKTLIRLCTDPNPKGRPTMNSLLESDFCS